MCRTALCLIIFTAKEQCQNVSRQRIPPPGRLLALLPARRRRPAGGAVHFAIQFGVQLWNHSDVRACVIFNPAARGDRARHFRRHVDKLGRQVVLKATAAPGDARRLAAQAIAEGFDLIVSAGGDGTVNEVLNGMGDSPGAWERVRLGILPLGTANVFARELKIPAGLEQAWKILQHGRERKMDLPRAEFSADGKPQRRYFIQLAGAGLDARAIERVNFSTKKKIGPPAYVLAGLKALREHKPKIKILATDQTCSGELVLIGNGKLYGGPFEVFPAAETDDGLLDICVFPRVNWVTLFCAATTLLLRRRLPERLVKRLRAERFELSGAAAFELDGERIGYLPASFSVERGRLRVLTP